MSAPDRPFLALSLSTKAKIAVLTGNIQAARSQLFEAIPIVRHARLPLAARQVYATVADLYENLGDAARAIKWRCRSQRTVESLANSLQPGDPLRSVAFFSGAGNGRPAIKAARMRYPKQT